MLAKCRSYLGYQEEPPHSNSTIFGQWYGLNPAPWCDMFLSYCAAYTGEAAVVGRFAWTVAHARWFRDRGQWNQTPSPGAIVFFDWSGSKNIDAIDHVGIVEAVNADGSIVTIEGNSDDVCARRVRRAFIAGYGHPAYSSEVAMRSMFDAAYPPLDPPKVDIAALYIGGNTPHVASDAEWARVMATGIKYRLPIFTRSHDGDPVADAKAAVQWAVAHGQPKGTLIALDFETRVDAAYLNAFDAVIKAAGYLTVVYGSLSTVLRNPRPSGGYWTAKWDQTPHLDAGATMTQYISDTQLQKPWDLSVVADSAPLWGGASVEVNDLGTFDGFAGTGKDAFQTAVKEAVRGVFSFNTKLNIPQGQLSNDNMYVTLLGLAQSEYNRVSDVLNALKVVSATTAGLADDESVILGALAALKLNLTDGQILQLASAVKIDYAKVAAAVRLDLSKSLGQPAA